jgi:hypothetical protein
MTFDPSVINPDDPRPIPHRQVRLWLAQHELSQRQLAMAIGREVSMVGKVLRRQATSAPVWAEIHRFMANPETYQPPQLRDRVLRLKVARAKRLLRRVERLA